MAARGGHLKVLTLLKRLGADMAAKELTGRTAFELAAMHGQHHLMQKRELWEAAGQMPPRPNLHVISAKEIYGLAPEPGRVHWSDVNQKRLRLAAQRGELSTVRQLLKCGADPDAEDELGRSAADLAAARGHVVVVEELKEAPRVQMPVGGAPLYPLSNGVDAEDGPPGVGETAENARLKRGEGADDEADDEDEEAVERVAVPTEDQPPVSEKKKKQSNDDGGSGRPNWGRARSGLMGLEKLGRARGPIPPGVVKLVRIFNKHASDDDAQGSIETAQLLLALEAAMLKGDIAATISSALAAIDIAADGPGTSLRVALPEYVKLVQTARRLQDDTEPPLVEGSGESLGAVFRRYDRDSSNSLGAGELRQAAADVGLRADAAAVAAVISLLEIQGRELSMAEFRALSKALIKEYKGAAGALKPAFQAAMMSTSMVAAGAAGTGTGETMGAVFRRRDVDGGGTLDMGELKPALGDVGIPVDNANVKAQLDGMEAMGAVSLDIKQFKALVKQLKAAVAAPAPPETVGAVFRRFDKDGGGTLDIGELRAALGSLQPTLDLSKPDAVAALGEVEASGTALDVKQFKAIVKRIKGAAAKLQPAFQAAMMSTSMVAAGAAGTGTGETIGAVFRRRDVDGGGTLDMGELKPALGDVGIPVSNPNVKAQLDAMGAVSLDIKQFKALVKQLKAAAAAAPPPETMGAIFRRRDVDGGGTLDMGEIKTALSDVGIDGDHPNVIAHLEQVEASGAVTLDIRQFKALVKALKLAVAEPIGEATTAGEETAAETEAETAAETAVETEAETEAVADSEAEVAAAAAETTDGGYETAEPAAEMAAAEEPAPEAAAAEEPAAEAVAENQEVDHGAGVVPPA